MPFKPKRVVTGHDAQGRSIILMNGEAPNSRTIPNSGGLHRTDIWETLTVPADNTGDRDAGDRPYRFGPHDGGTLYCIVEYPPDIVRLKSIDPKAQYGAAADTSGQRHPGMHKTDTIDYAIILSGEIYAIMEKGEVLLRAGDSLIQRGTNHAWSNRSDNPCVIAFIMISARPLA